ncbi:MAG: hypothetical protein GYA46_09935 [candidate division Zixibacteria bacterium]|nr:hypothetical protein [candidate division Zixibacteria bacterium]
MQRAIIYILIGFMVETAYAVTGTVTIGGEQSASGVLSIRNGIYLESSKQGVCGIRLIIKKVPDQLAGGNSPEYSNRVVTFDGSQSDIMQEIDDEVGSPCYYLVWGDTIGSTVHFPDTHTFAICQDAIMNLSSILDGLEDGTPSDYTSCPDSLACFLAAVPGEIQSDTGYYRFCRGGVYVRVPIPI